jgi:tetratricopeptide (TPR) repeat protein
VVSAPKYPEFIRPAVPAQLARNAAAARFENGWSFLQDGDLKNAGREFDGALGLAAGFYPAEAGLGYVELARKDPKAALPHFDKALASDSKLLAALVGRGQALLGLGRDGDALVSFEAALAIDSTVGDLARRVEVMRLRAQQQALGQAQSLARAGRYDEAISLYRRAIESSPDSAFLYRELAAVERQQGADDLAMEHFAKAAALEPGDAHSLAQMGELLEARGDYEGAAKAFASAVAIEPDADVEARLRIVRARADLGRLPAEYRAIDTAAEVTRGDLAALIAVRLANLVPATAVRDAVVITDIRDHWASSSIITVTRAGVMDVFANHGFQPRTIVHRTDLAQAVNRLLTKVAEAAPGRRFPWQGARLSFPDLSPGHLAYPAASVAVASGVMTTGANNAFQPTAVVSGRDAVEAIDRVAAIARAAPARGPTGR